MTHDMTFRGAISLLLGAALLGCYGTPRHDGPDVTDGAVDGGGDGTSFAIAITNPASPTYTNKALKIEVSVTSTAASQAVQLLDNGVLLATLSAPSYQFTWDTTTAMEGSHQLVAQTAVGDQIVASAPVTIIVDRTPPSIISKSPGTGADNVSLTDPMQVVFSEAIASSSVTAAAVKLTLGSGAVASTATLEADGKTISVAITNRASLALPGTMSETVAATITDLAGNPFSGASWSFTVPLWVDLGTFAGGSPQIELDPTGAPVVMNHSGSVQISRYLGGTNWDRTIPSPQTPGTVASATFAIAQANEIHLAWTESSGQQVHVARWTGTSWDRSYGTLLTSATATAEAPNIALTSTGQPVVRWVEPVNMGRGPGYVSRWNGSSWTSYPDAPGDYSGPVILDREDFPIVQAGNQISRWTGSSWTSPLGTFVYGLAINSGDQGIGLQTVSAIQPVALSKQGILTDYVPALTGESPQSTNGYGIVIDNLDEPIVTWFSYAGGTASSNAQLHVARWTGAQWDQGYGVLANAGGNCSIALAKAAIPIIAWEDFTATSTHVSKSNH